MYSLSWISEDTETPVGVYDSWISVLKALYSLLPTDVRCVSLIRRESKSLCDNHLQVPLYTVVEKSRPFKYLQVTRSKYIEPRP